MSTPIDARRPPLAQLTTLTLVGVGVADAIGFGRVFFGWSWLWRLILPMVAMHLIAAALRLWGRRFLTYPVSVVVALSVWAGVNFPRTLWGPFPSTATFRAFSDAARTAFSSFDTTVAPVAPSVGFVATASLCVLLCAVYADSAAFQGHVPLQALTCHVGMFGFCTVLARGPRQLLSAVAFVVAIGLHLVVVRAQRLGGGRWRSGDRLIGTRHLAAVGTLAIAVAAIGAAVPFDLLPLPERSRIDLRRLGRSESPRRVPSPLVSVRATIGNQADSEMFRVANATSARYWRLTSLEKFDGTNWSASSDLTDQMPEDDAPDRRSWPAGTSAETLRVTVANLGGVWLPGAYRIVGVDASFPTKYASGSSTAVQQRSGGLRSGDVYVARSVPNGNSPSEVPRGSDLTYVPPATDVAVRAVPEQQMAVANNPVEGLRNLQNWFRTFKYSTSADYSKSSDPTLAFLQSRSGFCQQFASTFALMARVVGFPARVAVGFTFGNRDPASGDYVVYGRHAHAWPEVYVAGQGWLAFEPTPGRGDPSNQSVTGVAGQQDNTPPPARPGASGASGASGVTTTLRPVPTTVPTTTPTPRSSSDGGGVALWPFLVIAAVLCPAIAVVLRLRWVRHRRSHIPDEPRYAIDHAWAHALSDLHHAGWRPRPEQSLASFARDSVTHGAPESVMPLAEIVDRRVFSADSPTTADADSAVALADDIDTAVTAKLAVMDRQRRNLGLPPRH